METARMRWVIIALGVVLVTALVTYLVVVGSPSLLEPGPLSSAHEGIDCLRCHGEYSGVQDALCLDCHGDVLELDWHSGARGEKECEECHYEHAGGDYITDLTKVPPHPERATPLSGVHTPVRCPECHYAGNVTGECSFCHERFIGETHQVGFTDECDLCHIQSIWDVDYDHAYEKATCAECHGDDPDHAYPGYLEYTDDCEVCHGVDRWLLPEFDHDEIGEPCVLCHPNSLDTTHSGRSDTCADCHLITSWTPQQILHDELEPPCKRCHEDQLPAEHLDEWRLGQLECDACHEAGVSWRRNVDHTNHTQPCVQCHGERPELHGKAYADDCQWCHVPDRRYELLPHPDQDATCTDCHVPEHPEGDRLRSVDASHATSCELCHVAGDAWESISVDHTALGQDCYECHDPPHADYSGFQVSCALCHGVYYWIPVQVDHDRLPEDCLSCHVPVHPNGKALFSQDCTFCHGTDDWAVRTWDHEEVTSRDLDCVNCHDDIHLGTLGIVCEDCHVTDTWETEVINP